MEKIIRKSYPRKGVKVELQEYFVVGLFPKRYWKVWVYFGNTRSLEVHGILTNKETAIDFYRLVCRNFKMADMV